MVREVKIYGEVALVKVSGVQLHFWNYETFKRIFQVWGSLVAVGRNVSKIVSYENVELLITIS